MVSDLYRLPFTQSMMNNLEKEESLSVRIYLGRQYLSLLFEKMIAALCFRGASQCIQKRIELVFPFRDAGQKRKHASAFIGLQNRQFSLKREQLVIFETSYKYHDITQKVCINIIHLSCVYRMINERDCGDGNHTSVPDALQGQSPHLESACFLFRHTCLYKNCPVPEAVEGHLHPFSSRKIYACDCVDYVLEYSAVRLRVGVAVFPPLIYSQACIYAREDCRNTPLSRARCGHKSHTPRSCNHDVFPCQLGG